jgi:tetratricopeptide (TPR) repeat protein
MTEPNTCGNPKCNNEGIKKCQACNSVYYCSVECQRTHWENHKGICKTIRLERNKNSTNSPIINLQEKISSPSSSSSSSKLKVLNSDVSPTIIKRLVEVKQETQKSFQIGDFASAVKSGEQGLLIAAELPDLESNIESIQIHVNLCTAYLQLGNRAEAEKHSNSSVLKADTGCRMRPNMQQSYDMLFVALSSNSIFLMNTDKLSDAEKVAVRALSLVEDRLPQTDPRLFKSLRGLAMIRDRLNKIDDAHALFVRAYEIAFKQWGPLQQEVQMCLDDLINILFKKNDVTSAKEYAQAHHDALVQKGVVDDDLLMADSAARRALILSRTGESPLADPLMKQALAIREKKLGPESQAVAVTLNALAGISEASGKPDKETEALLNKALEIFKKLPARANRY